MPILYPELRATNRGRAFVMRNFDMDHDGEYQVISPREAEQAANARLCWIDAGPQDLPAD